MFTTQPSQKMSGEWQKATITDLINAYKENENLYNTKHKLYFHKQARAKSLDNILQAVRKTKSDVTVNDIVRKIQILRTQFGQEINKMEKSKSLGNDDLIYVPKIWWFKHLQFIAKFMKTRNSPSTPLSVKLEQKLFNDTNENTEETFFELVETNENMDDELEEHGYEEQDDSSKSKKRRLEFTPNVINSTLNQADKLKSRTIEYIINEETSELIPNEHIDNVTEIEPATKPIDHKKFKRKAKAFGDYVGCLMREITDDKLFYETQNEILKVLENATLKNPK